MDDYYWYDGKKVEIEKIPGSFGVGLANFNTDLALEVSDYFIDKGFVTVAHPKRLLISGPDLKPEELRELWPRDKIRYITYLYQNDKSRMFPTDELRISSEQFSAQELKSLDDLVKRDIISSLVKRNFNYECRVVNPDGDQGIKVYQQIYEELGIPVDINFVKITHAPRPKKK